MHKLAQVMCGVLWGYHPSTVPEYPGQKPVTTKYSKPTSNTNKKVAMPEHNIKVSGPFKVLPPHEVKIQECLWPKQLWPVINEGNTPRAETAIAWCPDRYNAQWVANALNMLYAIDEQVILRSSTQDQQISHQATVLEPIYNPDGSVAVCPCGSGQPWGLCDV